MSDTLNVKEGGVYVSMVRTLETNLYVGSVFFMSKRP